MLFNEALLYCSMIVPFVLPNIQTAGFILIGIVSVFVVSEIIAICNYRKQVDLPATNCYLFTVTIAGYCRRIMVLALAYLGGLLIFKGKNLIKDVPKDLTEV